MSKNEPKKKLVGPWRDIHGAIWLIGLAILAWKGWWWPGILVLIAISIITEALLMQFAPHAFEQDKQTPAPSLVPSPVASAPPAQSHRLDLLPSTCPACGGPIRGHEVKWTGAQSANCPYCGMNLPMGISR